MRHTKSKLKSFLNREIFEENNKYVKSHKRRDYISWTIFRRTHSFRIGMSTETHSLWRTMWEIFVAQEAEIIKYEQNNRGLDRTRTLKGSETSHLTIW